MLIVIDKKFSFLREDFLSMVCDCKNSECIVAVYLKHDTFEFSFSEKNEAITFFDKINEELIN